MIQFIGATFQQKKVFSEKINMQRSIALIVLIGIFLSSCQLQTSIVDESINGVWKSIGSGGILQINDSTDYALYDISSVSCLPNRKGELEEIMGELRLKSDTLSLLVGVVEYYFLRIDEVPELCTVELKEGKRNDPLFNFEVFAETVKEHYAFFKLNNINWKDLYQQQREKLNTNSTDAELYQVIEETLEKLNDNHAFLEATDELYEELEELSVEEEEAIEDELPEYGDFPVAKMVAAQFMEEELTNGTQLIQWGKINEEVGFIQIKAMWLYADIDIPESLVEEMGYVDAFIETRHKMYEGDYIEKEVLGVSGIMDKVMTDLAAMESIVIDVRFNGGGQDAVSFEILSRFLSKDLQIGNQKLRYGDQFSPSFPYIIKGTKNAYLKPVYVLTSPQTGSAAETFALATMSMGNVKRIGAATTGATSTSLEKKLPNAWDFAISNEILMDNQGRNYENIGIPPDYELSYSRDRQTFFRSVVNDLEVDKKSILDAIEVLEDN